MKYLLASIAATAPVLCASCSRDNAETPGANCSIETVPVIGGIYESCEVWFPITDDPRVVTRIATAGRFFVGNETRQIYLADIYAPVEGETGYEEGVAVVSNLVAGKFVRVEQICSRPQNAIIAKVWVDGVELGSELLRLGLVEKGAPEELTCPKHLSLPD